jgi:uncharacterized membrane protein
MVLMVLDHARDMWFGFTPDPTDLEATTVPLFLTRVATHICAPVFVFLAGIAAYYYRMSHGPAASSGFLLKRGLWLIVLEFTIIKLAFIPEPFFEVFLLQVIWAIGCSMICLALISRLPPAAILVIGLSLVAGHNLLDSLVPADFGGAAPLWTILHEGGQLELAGRVLMVSYPILPWIGVMALGFVFGSILSGTPDMRSAICLRFGVALTLGFLLLRFTGLYGDPLPFEAQASAAKTWMAFFNTQKYPPSLQYLLMTLGPALILLAWFERIRVPGWLVTIGSVPLFFYVAHLYLLRFTSAPISLWRFGEAALEMPPGIAGAAKVGLPATYIIWVLAVFLLYIPCRWFAELKQRRRDLPWLSYL